MFIMKSRRCQQSRYMSALFIFLAITAIVSGDNSVHLVSDKQHQSVTSSTLYWLPVNQYDQTKSIVVGGFRETEDGNRGKKEKQMFICRVFHGGAWVTGTQLEGEKHCTVTSLGNIASYHRYELLENVENAARLSWIPWDKYHAIPPGTVKVDTLFVARYVANKNDNGEETSPSKIQYIGTLDNTRDLGKITYVKDNDREEASVTEGEILVETEPIYYELRSIKLNTARKRVLKNEPRIIGEAVISNSHDDPEKLAQAFGYSYKYFSYWGQGHAMIKALNTSIILGNGTRLYDIAWGTDDETSERTNTYTVEIHLQPGTAVNVTLRANHTDSETPYTGDIVSYYSDGEFRTRPINGKRRESTLTDIKPEFSPIYFLSNLSIVPTTLEPPTTIGTTSTTSRPTSKATTLNIDTSGITSTAITAPSNEDDENMIVPPRKTDVSNIQNDDRGPMSLENKEDSDYSSSSTVESCATILIASFMVHLYQIT